MALPPLTEKLLAGVARRWRWAELGKRFVQWSCWLAALFLLGLMVARLSALLPDVFTPPTLLLIPALGAVLAWLTYRRVARAEAARMVDRFQGNHDLFLTAVHLDASAGTYQERIRERAEAVASQGERMAEVVPWNWRGSLGRLFIVAIILSIAIRWLPQWDPFGKDEERQWLGRQEDRLEALERETEAQLKALAPSEEEASERDEAIQQSLTKLREAFRLAKPEERRETAQKLRESQKELGQFWKQLNDDKLREALDEAASEQMQQFGKSGRSLTPEAKALRDQLREMLREGEAKELQKKLSEMLEKAEALQKPGATPEERRQGAKELQRSLQELADAVASEAPSEALKDTLQRAIEQMQMAQNEALGEKAMEGAQKSMEQLQRQMEGLAQQLQQLQRLEEALDAARLAQQLNEMGKMPGEADSSGTMKDYAELYRELLAQMGAGREGEGEGMRGPGTGEGGVAPEDESLETAFKDEKSPSHLVAGKTLLEWKTEGVSEAGEARQAYQESITQLKQGLSEAIRQEQVPAGYHSQIRSYFDRLEEAPPMADDLD